MQEEGKSIFVLMFITFFSRIIGFIRLIILASMLGVRSYTDAYIVSVNIPTVIFASIGVAAGTTFIPMYLNIVEEKGKKEGMDFTNNVLNIIIILTIIIVFLGLLFAKPIVKIFAFGFEDELFDMTVTFTRILLPAIVFIGIKFILRAYLHANNKFNMPVIINIINNFILIMFIITSYFTGPNILIYGTLIGMIVQVIVLFCFARKKDYSYKFNINFYDKHIKKQIYLIIPVFLGSMAHQLNVLIDSSLSSTLMEGSISALNFANKLTSFIYGVFAMSIVNVIYSKIAKLATKSNEARFKKFIKKSVNIMLIILVPISIGIICLNKPIVKLLFERGNFDSTATLMTATALLYYSFGIVGVGVRNLLSRIFYSLQDTKTPMINGIIAVSINIILDFILVRYMGYKGLALATSISALLGASLLFISLKRKIGDFYIKQILFTFIKVLLASIIMGLIINYFHIYISIVLCTNVFLEIIILILTIMLGVFIYGIIIYFLNIKELKMLIDNLIKFINKIKKK